MSVLALSRGDYAGIRGRCAELGAGLVDPDAVAEAAVQRIRTGRDASPEGPPEAVVERACLDATSAALVRCARDRAQQRSARNRLVYLWRRQVLWWCRGLCGSRLSASDVAQGVLIRLMEDLHQLRDEERFRTWLHSVTWRAVRGERRRAWFRRVTLWEPGPLARREQAAEERPDALHGRAEEIRQVAAVMDRLDPESRDLLWLRYGEELSRREMLEVLGWAEGSLNRKLSRARAAFAQQARRLGLREQGLETLGVGSSAAPTARGRAGHEA